MKGFGSLLMMAVLLALTFFAQSAEGAVVRSRTVVRNRPVAVRSVRAQFVPVQAIGVQSFGVRTIGIQPHCGAGASVLILR